MHITFGYTLINLSTELVDAIVDCVDDPTDLLNSALTCKKLYQIIVPGHLEFRHIRCDPMQQDLWCGLSQRPALAKKVRFLEVRWNSLFGTSCWGELQSKDLLPRSMKLASVSPEMDLMPLVKAIRCMYALVRFSWIGWMPEGIGHLWRAINNLPRPLKELQLLYNDSMNIPAISLISQGLPLKHLPSLTALAIIHLVPNAPTYLPHNPCYEAFARDTGIYLRDLLIRFVDPGACFQLETNGTSFAHFCKMAHLYQLRRLTIQGYVDSDISEDLTMFLSRHLKLEALWLGHRRLLKLKEANIILPNLKALQFGHYPFEPEVLERIPEDICKGLKHLHVPLHSEGFSFVLNNLPHLESCYLYEVTNISQLHIKLPLLQRLDFKPQPYRHQRGKASESVQKWLKDLSKLTKLTHLSGFFTDSDVCLAEPNYVQKLVQDLANELRDLKHVKLYYENPSWITIDRDSNGDYSGFHGATLSTNRLEEWGGFFLGYR